MWGNFAVAVAVGTEKDTPIAGKNLDIAVVIAVVVEVAVVDVDELPSRNLLNLELDSEWEVTGNQSEKGLAREVREHFPQKDDDLPSKVRLRYTEFPKRHAKNWSNQKISNHHPCWHPKTRLLHLL